MKIGKISLIYKNRYEASKLFPKHNGSHLWLKIKQHSLSFRVINSLETFAFFLFYGFNYNIFSSVEFAGKLNKQPFIPFNKK